MTELAIRENLPDHSGLFDAGGNLDDLMWIGQVELDCYRLLVIGIIKPDPSLKTVRELREQLTDSYHKIVTTLEEAGIPFWSYPELYLKGNVYQRGPDFPPQIYDVKATIRIEVAQDWTCR